MPSPIRYEMKTVSCKGGLSNLLNQVTQCDPRSCSLITWPNFKRKCSCLLNNATKLVQASLQYRSESNICLEIYVEKPIIHELFRFLLKMYTAVWVWLNYTFSTLNRNLISYLRVSFSNPIKLSGKIRLLCNVEQRVIKCLSNCNVPFQKDFKELQEWFVCLQNQQTIYMNFHQNLGF